MRNYLFLFILTMIGSVALEAQDISFRATAPKTVVKGTQFRIEYVLKNTSGDEEIKIDGDFKGFDFLFGPSKSVSYSTSIINGKSSSENSEVYSYVLQANEEGTFSMPTASITAKGKRYTTNVVRVEVLPPDKHAQETEPGRQPQAIVQKSKGTIDPEDAFVRAIFSKTKIHEQEAVVATFRFYTTLNIRSVGNIEFPEFEGFMTEEFEMSANREWKMEHYKGRNYMVVDVKKTLLFPQRSGEIEIPSGKMEMVFEISTGKVLRHPLFGAQEVTEDKKTTLSTSPVKLNIAALPDGKPLGFSGGVGSFTLKSNLSNTDIKANDAITLTIDIAGHGNMKLLRNPEIKLDKNFEVYDPKVINKFVPTANGLSGTKSVEYLFIPRYPGKYTIPSVEFSYYDLNSRAYKTMKTEEYELNVVVDPNAKERSQATSFTNQSEVKVAQDVRYLKLGEYDYSKSQDFRISKTSYILWYIIPALLFALTMFVYRKQIKANADIAGMRTKRANRVANRRLKMARKYLKENNKDGYYDELLRAVWGYLSDKLTIPVAELNRENVDAELQSFGADKALIDEYISIIDTCEFARYAPPQEEDAMGNLYNETVDAIGKMENTIKIK